ncbi:hypothetical protein BZG29_23710 [Janthinobacterium sp. LM6]|nr:hypothetical protein BZG29_23710 [Janthinobacterium sp. LM6]
MHGHRVTAVAVLVYNIALLHVSQPHTIIRIVLIHIWIPFGVRIPHSRLPSTGQDGVADAQLDDTLRQPGIPAKQAFPYQ